VDPDGSYSESRVLMTKNLKNQLKKNYLLLEKNAIYLSLGPLKGHPSYRRSLQPSKENI
jgi:hypothetical protein